MDLDSDPTPDSTLSFGDFKDRILFHLFFQVPRRHIIVASSVIKLIFFWLKFVLQFNFARIISGSSTPSVRKGKDPDPYM